MSWLLIFSEANIINKLTPNPCTFVYLVDLQLDVKGCKDVYESFDKYVEVERLEGDNKYHAEGHDLQVGCLFAFHFYVVKAVFFRSFSYFGSGER